MLRRMAFSMLVVALALTVAAPAFAGGGPPRDGDGNRVRAVVYVESQKLYYDSIIGPALPWKGPFQKLDPTGGPHGGPATEFGKGDPEYVGGRWWVDANPNGYQDEHDVYFSCPLLGPGRETP